MINLPLSREGIKEKCPDMADEIFALSKRLNSDGEFSGPAKKANEQRFKKLCRDALLIGDFPEAVKERLEEEVFEIYCTQNDGDCSTCSLVNYGRDCHNNPLK